MNRVPRSSNADDWDLHWDRYGEAAARNPANDYRHRLILSLLGRPSPPARILDIGSGQGEFALLLSRSFPDAEIRGIEYSETGVRRSREAAQALRVSATFEQRDLLASQTVDPSDQHWATMAICSEVLEHVDEPARLLRNVQPYLAPACRLIVTVPGGPRTAFDRHIGHRRHYTASTLRSVLEAADLRVERIMKAGFPFFNLYKLVVMARGEALIADVDRVEARPPSRLTDGVLTFFDAAFRANLPSSPLGWQLVATATSTVSG